MDQVNIDTSTLSSSSLSRSFLYKKSPRNKGIKIGNNETAGHVSRPRYSKKPDPLAPKITSPCVVCGRKFWSWKALFGHMRCHPERQWRGINPPRPNLIRHEDNDNEVAASLLLLANGPTTTSPNIAFDQSDLSSGAITSLQVFGSHRTLRRHRASHRNIDEEKKKKKNDGVVAEVNEQYGHQCSICFRVFPSGQALGGHKRCHWEKGEEESLTLIGLNDEKEVCGLDLNLPADPMDDNSSCTFSSPVSLDLRLRL